MNNSRPLKVGQKFVNGSGHSRFLGNKRDERGRFTKVFTLSEMCQSPYMHGTYKEVIEYAMGYDFVLQPQNQSMSEALGRQRYRCKVYWEMSAEVEVRANGETDAQVQALNKVVARDIPLSGAQFVPDSENCDVDMDVVQIN